MDLVLATHNSGKVKDLIFLLKESSLKINILSLKDLGVEEECPENGLTFEENACSKAVFYSQRIKDKLILADDSGLCVKALGNKPGVYSSRYAGENATYEDNNLKLLKDMENIKDRAACFVSYMALAFNSNIEASFEGQVKGEISFAPQGKGGFGYDPLFIYKDKKSFAEISHEVKNLVSHRALAFYKVLDFLKKDYL